jgi:hypothetical protein
VSQLADSQQIHMSEIVIIIIGIPVTMAVIGRGLSALNDLYARVSGNLEPVRVVAPWRRSLRDERGSGRRTTVLDVVMVVSVLGALAVLGVWFLAFAHGGGLPSSS